MNDRYSTIFPNIEPVYDTTEAKLVADAKLAADAKRTAEEAVQAKLADEAKLEALYDDTAKNCIININPHMHKNSDLPAAENFDSLKNSDLPDSSDDSDMSDASDSSDTTDDYKDEDYTYDRAEAEAESEAENKADVSEAEAESESEVENDAVDAEAEENPRLAEAVAFANDFEQKVKMWKEEERFIANANLEFKMKMAPLVNQHKTTGNGLREIFKRTRDNKNRVWIDRENGIFICTKKTKNGNDRTSIHRKPLKKQKTN